MVMYWLFLLVGAVRTSDGLKVREFCSGEKFSIPAGVMSTVPLVSYIYFTPITPGANTSMVMNMTQSLDPHYKYKDKTVFIPEVSERDQGTFSWSPHDSTQLTDFLKLKMKDCYERKNVHYGDYFDVYLVREAKVLEFTPTLQPSNTQVVWREGEPYRSVWSVKAATSDHAGNYTPRTHSGVELKKTWVTVIDNPKTLEFIVQEDRNLDVALPIPASKVSITLKDPSGAEHNLYKSGRGVLETLNLFEGRFSLQNHLSGSILQIHDLKPGDAGTYEVRDSKGLLIVSVLVISDITDCSERMEVQYGESLRILMPRRADVLEFSPSYDPSDTQVVWRREWASRAVWSVVADLDHEGTYSARTDNDLELQRTCVTVIEDPRAHKYAYITIAVMAIVFVLACWCVCKCCCNKKRSSNTSPPLNQSPGLYSAPEEPSWCQPRARSPLMDGFSQIPSVPDAQGQGTSVYPLPPNLSQQSDVGPCFQPTKRDGDSLDFLFTSPLTTDRLPDTVYTSDKLNFL